MHISFLTPLAALVGLAVAAPLVAAILRERRAGPIRATLGLLPPRRRAHVPFAAAAVAFFALVAAAAAQPVLQLEEDVRARTDAEAFFVFDVSRSMLASESPAARTRFERALELGLELRRALPDVPVGIASTTDRPLSHLFPTGDRDAFVAVARSAIGIERPPPFATDEVVATDLATISALARDNYFSTRSVRRLVVLFSDGESVPFQPAAVVKRLGQGSVGLMVVRFWSPSERVFGPGGRPEPRYRPEPAAQAAVERLAAGTAGGRVFEEQELAAIAAAARKYVGEGPAVVTGESERTVPLAAYLVLAAGVPLAFLLVRRAAR
jgi:hypothetical protein